MIAAQEALQHLQDGNRRFVDCIRSDELAPCALRRQQLVSGQAPFAVVIGCSDSRVPVELIFDQGLGNLFVIRVAGNVIATTQLGSVEYAVEMLGTRLVVVLGHTGCGAVNAVVKRAIDGGTFPQNLSVLVDRLMNCVADLLPTDGEEVDIGALCDKATRANVHAAIKCLTDKSDALSQAVAEGRVQIVGAEYSPETGEVEFLEDMN